jgi:hypothetical protein
MLQLQPAYLDKEKAGGFFPLISYSRRHLHLICQEQDNRYKYSKSSLGMLVNQAVGDILHGFCPGNNLHKRTYTLFRQVYAWLGL